MSSEKSAARGHLVAVAAVLAALAVTAVVLAVALVTRGPQVREVAGDPEALVTVEGSKLVLRADQPLAEDSLLGAAVTPEAGAVFSVSGSSVELRFEELLDYGTTYRVVLPALVGRDTGAEASFEYAFTTSPLQLHTLVRGAEEDRVVRHLLDDDEVLLSAPLVQEYAPVAGGAAAVALDEAGQSSVIVADDQGQRTLPLPGPGAVTSLHGSDEAGLLGFLFTGAGTGGEPFTSVLFLTVLADGQPAPVGGIDGNPLQVEDWGFVPGTAHLVARAFDGSLYLIDGTGAAPVQPLGSHGRFLGFVPGTTSFVAEDDAGSRVINLADGSVGEPMPRDEITGAAPVVVSGTQFLRPSGSPLEGAAVDQPRVLLESAGESREVLRLPDDGSWIREVCASPNRRYMAAEIVPAGATGDGYPAASAWTGMSTVVVDLASGDVVLTAEGIQPDWCR
ncbi:MAG TPA: hypothetical protein PKE40_08705 [Arachnia sp.]|nr:hypothetical protein [Arachnia sp.]HMT86417.1 hypothetical protein [Arachnia sp.]